MKLSHLCHSQSYLQHFPPSARTNRRLSAHKKTSTPLCSSVFKYNEDIILLFFQFVKIFAENSEIFFKKVLTNAFYFAIIHKSSRYRRQHAGMAQSVEHVIGNDEVISSILITSSKKARFMACFFWCNKGFVICEMTLSGQDNGFIYYPHHYFHWTFFQEQLSSLPEQR